MSFSHCKNTPNVPTFCFIPRHWALSNVNLGTLGGVPVQFLRPCTHDINGEKKEHMVQGGPPTSYKWSYNPYK